AVTLTEAWTELGIDPGADADTVRRAYLRLIKTRKPESDPMGFQRAREAFEIARAGGEIESLAAESARRHAPAFSTPSTAAPTGEAGAPPPPDSDAAPADGESQSDIVFEGFSSAWHSIPASADQRQRLEIAREAVAVLPNDPRAHWLLATTLSRLGPDSALADALRAGWRAGFPEFLEALLVRLPARASREEIDAGFASPEPTVRLAAAAAGASWAADRSGALVAELCRSAMDAPLEAREDHVRDLPVPRMLDVVLALHAAGAVDAANQAQAALRDCLHETGLELAMVHGPLGGVWTLAEEIAALPRDFPQPLRTAFAISTRSGDLSSAFVDTIGVIQRDRASIRRWATDLVTSAPNVSGILRSALAQDTSNTVDRAGFQVSRLGYLLIPVLLAVVRVCSSSHDTHYGSIVTNTSTVTARPYLTRTPMSGGPGSTARIGLDMVERASAALCGPEGPRNGQLVCADILAYGEALRAAECSELPKRLKAIKRALVNSKTQTEDARFFGGATIAQFQLCGGQGGEEKDTE
ncbi:MAG TPA: J domain-containing protein, partial [Polyangia bacterium]